jgi:hypothetical protein
VISGALNGLLSKMHRFRCSQIENSSSPITRRSKGQYARCCWDLIPVGGTQPNRIAEQLVCRLFPVAWLHARRIYRFWIKRSSRRRRPDSNHCNMRPFILHFD